MGFASLLNVPSGVLHHTVFVVDQELSSSLRTRIRQALAAARTHVHFVPVSSHLLEDVRGHGIRIEDDYVSLHCWATRFSSHQQTLKLLSQLRRFDFCRLEFPADEVAPFQSRHLENLVDTLLASNYAAQDRKIAEFYSGLAKRKPNYQVSLQTGADDLLIVTDDAPWFQLGGSLVEGESRILPSGEVAYTGSRINGTFTADGTLLAAPQRAAVAPLARRLADLRGSLRTQPLTFTIENGRVTELKGEGELYALLSDLLALEAYRQVVEVGIGFNRACADFQHEWPSPANEAHPGAHIAIGGDPDPDQPDREVAVHIDWMANRSRIRVNGEEFRCET